MSDKIYAETQGEAPFDWWKALRNPPPFDSAEHFRLCHLAADWVTCACGNQCAIIPRTERRWGTGGHPVDDSLRELGVIFLDHVQVADWNAAQDTLSAIEARSQILIAEELAKRNTP